jgi:TIR domain
LTGPPYSSKDKAAVRDVAQRLRADGLRVWFDQWELRPGDSIPSKIEEGLEHSRVLVLCMSRHAFGADWALLESGTFRFRDPLNKERRFIPLRLDDAPIRGSLAQFLYINWLGADRDQEYGFPGVVGTSIVSIFGILELARGSNRSTSARLSSVHA